MTLQNLLGPLVTQLLGQRGSEKVTIGEIESRLRDLTSSAQEAVSDSKQTALAASLLGGAAVIAAAYLHGRRRGRRRATVLEIRRS